MTIELYTIIKKEKKPVPSKFHYTFNMRDVAKIIQGLVQANPKCTRSREQYSRLWCHET